jgi:hypothetical protein
MRGGFEDRGGLFSYIRTEERLPVDHPLRKVHDQVREVLTGLNRTLVGAIRTKGGLRSRRRSY